MAKKYKYLRRVKTKSGKWRYIYENTKTKDQISSDGVTLEDYAKIQFHSAYETAYNGASKGMDVAKKGVENARKNSEAATAKRKAKQDAYNKSNDPRKANKYTPQDPYKDYGTWRGNSDMGNSRGNKSANKRGSVYVGPADHFTDMNDQVVIKKKTRGSTSVKRKSRG